MLLVSADRPFYHEALPHRVVYDTAQARAFLVSSTTPPDWLMRAVLEAANGRVAAVECATNPCELHLLLADPEPAYGELCALVAVVAGALERVYMRGGHLREVVEYRVNLFSVL